MFFKTRLLLFILNELHNEFYNSVIISEYVINDIKKDVLFLHESGTYLFSLNQIHLIGYV